MTTRSRMEFFLKISLPVLIWIGSCMCDAPKISSSMAQVKAVKDRLLRDYDRDVRPTTEESNTTQVATGLVPDLIVEVDEERSLLSLVSYFFVTWNDPRLVWDAATEYDGYLQLSSDLLWKPDITVYNSHSMHVNPTQNVLLLVTSYGDVFWVPPIFTRTSCPALLEAAYPDEVVTCNVGLGSWVHDGWQIDFTHWAQLHLTDFKNINPRWELIEEDTKVFRNVTFYEGYNEPYISIEVVLPLRRRTPPGIAATRNPCILVMLLNLSIFWLPTNSSKKVFLGGILFLALTILSTYVAYSTKLPIGAVFAVSFLQSTMYILTITLLLEIFVIFHLCNITGAARPPSSAMQFLNGSFGKYACLRTSFCDGDLPIDKVQPDGNSPASQQPPGPKVEWLLFAAGLDRLFFVLVSVAMIAIHHS